MAERSLRLHKTFAHSSSPHNSQGNVRVVCRFRPLSSKERSESSSSVKFLSTSSVSVANQYDDSLPLKFFFDSVFTPEATQREVYESAALPIIKSVLEGFNGTVLVYGQTASGKTFTMMGSDVKEEGQRGIVPRVAKEIFEFVEEADPNLEFAVKVGFCEIYMEKIRDLLMNQEHLKIVEDKTRGVYIQGLTEEYVVNEKKVLSLLRTGCKNREVAFTLMNEASSRSHSIFLITITQTDIRDLSSKTSKLYLVDLAGSEKAGKSGLEGKRLKEAKNINRSLSTLGLVINSLTDSKSTHIPYRDSKLTRLLQDSLGGNSKTCLIITCSPALSNESETVSTLRFGIRAKAVKNKPKINKDFSILELKQLLQAANEKIEEQEQKIELLEKILKNKKTGFESENDSFMLQELKIEQEKLSDEVRNSQNLEQALSDQITKCDRILRENSNLNEKLMGLLITIQEIEEKLLDSQEETHRQKKMIELKTLQINELEQIIKIQEGTIVQQTHRLEKAELEYCPVAEKSILANDMKELHDQVRTKEDSIRTNYSQILDESTEDQGSLMQDSRLTQSFTLDLEPYTPKAPKVWKTQKKSLLADIKEKDSMIQQLRYEKLDSQLHQRELEKLRYENERRLRQRVTNIEQELTSLNRSYDGIQAKLHEKRKKSEKISKFNERLQKLENSLNVQTADLDQLSTITEEPLNVHKKGHARLKRSIKGGQSGDSRFSTVLGCD